MNLNRVRVIIDKEWAEVFKHRMVLVTISLMPILFTILPLAIIYFVSSSSTPPPDGSMPDFGSADVPPQFLESCGDVSSTECLQIFMTNQFLLMFMMMPLMIPTAIAAYSIVGEKTTRSLEPLLATPISTGELLTGKALAAVVPAVLITWLCFGIYLLLLPLVGGTPGLMRYVTGPTWLTAVLALGPLMAVAAVNLAVIVSSRVNDPRVAEQMTAVLIVPLIAVLFAQLAGLLVIDLALMATAVVMILLVDAALIYAGVRLFQRETILTRWK